MTFFSRPNVQAIMLTCLGYAGYSAADIIAKFMQQTYSTQQFLMTASGLGVLTCVILIVTMRGWRALFPHNLKWHLLRTCCNVVTALCVVTAVRTLPLADFYGVIFASPFILLILAAVLLKEFVGWQRYASVIVGFIGVLIVVGPQYETFGFDFLLAFIAAISIALSLICMRKIGGNDFILVYALYPFAGILMATTLWTSLSGDFVSYDPGTFWLFFLQVLVVIVGAVGCSLGYGRASETAIVAPFHYTQVIWGIIFGYVMFNDIPVLTTWIGLTLVCGSGFYAIWREYRTRHLPIHSAPAR